MADSLRPPTSAGLPTQAGLPILIFLSLISILFLLGLILFALRGRVPRSTRHGSRGTLPRYSILLFFFLGILLTSLHLHTLSQSELLRLARLGGLAREKKFVTVYGRVAEIPDKTGERVSFSFWVDRLSFSDTLLRLKEKTRVVVETDPSSRNEAAGEIEAGDILLVRGRMELLPSGSEFESRYENYLFRQGIQTTVFASRQNISVKKEGKNPLLSLSNRARRYLYKNIYRLLPEDEAGLMLGILLGDTRGISEETKEDFRKTGLTHILAVSGMNVTILVIASFFLVGFIPGGNFLKYPFIVLVIIFYAFLTEFQPSVLRASLMASIGISALLFGRQHYLLNSLAIAALVLLIVDPFLLYSISFQLSFAATLAIIVLMPILEERLSFVPRMARGVLALTLAAQLGTIPLLVYHFQQLSTISLLANLLVVPAVFPAMIFGMALSVLPAISWSVARMTSFLSLPLIKYMLKTPHLLATLPLSSLYLPSPALWQIGGYYLMLAASVWSLRRIERRPNPILTFIIILSLVVTFMGCQIQRGTPPNGLRVTFVDAGQGDATLIQTPQGESVLIDGGEGTEAVMSALLKNGVRKVDLLILSHPHADHLGGLVSVIENYRVDLVLDGAQPHTSRLYLNFLKTVERKKIPYKVARKGQSFKVGKVDVDILAPSESFIRGTDSDVNNNSVVARVTYGNLTLLFPGDVQVEGEKRLVSTGQNLKSVVFKVSHHGDSSAADFDFLKRVSPRVAVISVGAGNSFGHPSRSTLRKLEQLGSEIFRTDRSGNVTILSDGKRFEVRTAK